LTDEVLRQQPAAIQRFLLHTAILDRLNVQICDAVMDHGGSQGILEGTGNLRSEFGNKAWFDHKKDDDGLFWACLHRQLASHDLVPHLESLRPFPSKGFRSQAMPPGYPLGAEVLANRPAGEQESLGMPSRCKASHSPFPLPEWLDGVVVCMRPVSHRFGRTPQTVFTLTIFKQRS
jgi:hypothetical protein